MLCTLSKSRGLKSAITPKFSDPVSRRGMLVFLTSLVKLLDILGSGGEFGDGLDELDPGFLVVVKRLKHGLAHNFEVSYNFNLVPS